MIRARKKTFRDGRGNTQGQGLKTYEVLHRVASNSVAQRLKPRPYKVFVITSRFFEVCLPTVAVMVLGSVLADAYRRLGSLTCCGGRLVLGSLCSVWLLEVCLL